MPAADEVPAEVATEPEPVEAPEPEPAVAQPEPPTASYQAPEPGATVGNGLPTANQSWVRRHRSQIALAVTFAGGAIRMLARNRRRRW